MNVDFMQAVQIYFANYANFKGRSTRAEYWWVELFLFLVGIVIQVLCWIFGLQQGSVGYWILYCGIELLFFIPSLAITVRRLHDVGKGGGWIFISCIPLIGWIWFLILTLTKSEGDNRFGASAYGTESI